MEPASTIIRLCGGAAKVAEMVGRDPSRIHRWTYPKDKGGTDGLIPSDAAQVLLAEAKKREIPLTADHFFAPPQQGAA